MLAADVFIRDLGEELGRHQNFHPSLHELLAAQRLIAHLRDHVSQPLAPLKFLTYLAPIFCHTAEQQAQFPTIYLEWLGRQTEPATRITASIAEKSAVRRARPIWIRATVLGGSLALMMATGGWVLWQEQRERVFVGSVVLDGNPADQLDVQFGQQEAQTDGQGKFQVTVQTREMPAQLTVVGADGKTLTKEVGQEFASYRRWFYLQPASWKTDYDSGVLEFSTQNGLPDAYETQDAQEPISVPTQGSEKLPTGKVLNWTNILVVSSPVFGFLLWFVVSRWPTPALKRLRSRFPEGLREIQIQAGSQQVLPTGSLRSLAHRLRDRRDVESPHLNVSKTVARSVQRGGLFTPVWGGREEPGYLALIDRSCYGDHHAQLATQIVQRMAHHHVLIRHCEFDRDPTVLRMMDEARRARTHPGGAAAETFELMSLEELRARYPLDRVLVFAETETWFNGLTGLPHPWVERLMAWEDRFVCTIESPERWKSPERLLQKLGFRFMTLNQRGFLDFSRALDVPGGGSARPRARESGRRLIHRRRETQWLERHTPSPSVIDQLCGDLNEELKSPGFLWLAACAAYPETRWGLTVSLGLQLVPSQAEVETIFPKLTRLVWFRHAFMPDWFRRAILTRLSQPDAERVRECLSRMLGQIAVNQTDGLTLPVATGEPTEDDSPGTWNRFWKWCQTWRRTAHAKSVVRDAPPGSPLKDYVFIRFLSGKDLDPTTPLAPRKWLQAVFPEGKPWLGWRAVSLLVSSGVAAILLAILLFPLTEWPQKIVGKDGAVMVMVSAGGFTMGAWDDDKEAQSDERPAHQVYLDDFYIDQYEVTTSRYAKFFQKTKRAEPRYWSDQVLKQHSDKPVVGVTWEDANAYCSWAGKRLPTEAEWEKAARGTDQRLYPWGQEPPSKKLANFDNCCNFKDYGMLTDVGSFEGGKSPYGAYDMAGNVWEWVADWYSKDYYRDSLEANPKGPSSGISRVLRGGSWFNDARYLRSSYRIFNSPTNRFSYFGFRCAQGAR